MILVRITQYFKKYMEKNQKIYQNEFLMKLEKSLKI